MALFLALFTEMKKLNLEVDLSQISHSTVTILNLIIAITKVN